MKYFKFTQISKETGISWAVEQPVSGPSWPDLPGLDLSGAVRLAHAPIYYLSKADDSAVGNPGNHIFELTIDEYARELKTHVEHVINVAKDTIYQEEYKLRQEVFSKYHETASIAGVYKYQQAKQLLIDAEAEAPDVRVEAATRGLDVLVMANRIVQNHESFRTKEAKIAGLRGKILDRLENYSFNSSNPDASYASFIQEEVIGTETIKAEENGVLVDKAIDIKVSMHLPCLELRFKYE